MKLKEDYSVDILDQDKLNIMYDHQLDLQNKLKVNYDQRYFNDMVLACIVELTEVLNETSWKPWKKQQELNPNKIKEELIDVLHFFFNLCIWIDLEPEEMFKKYMVKQNVNRKRQEQGY